MLKKELLHRLGLQELPPGGHYCEWSKSVEIDDRPVLVTATLATLKSGTLTFSMGLSEGGAILSAEGEVFMDAESEEFFEMFVEEVRGMRLQDEPLFREA